MPVRDSGTRRSAWPRTVAATNPTVHDDAIRRRQTRIGSREGAGRAGVDRRRTGSGSAWPRCTAAAAARSSLSADRLAAARGRGARALRRPARSTSLPTCSASAAARRSTSCSRGSSRTSAAGSAACGSSRRSSRSRASRSSPCSLARLGGRARGADRDSARRRELGAPLPRRLRAHVQPLPVHERALVSRARSRALERGGLAGWALWALAILASVATHPYGALVLASQGVFVVVSRATRLREALWAFGAVARARDPVLAHRPRPRGPVRRRRRRRRRKLGGP